MGQVIYVLCSENERDMGFLKILLGRHPVAYHAVVKPNEVATYPLLAACYLGHVSVSLVQKEES